MKIFFNDREKNKIIAINNIIEVQTGKDLDYGLNKEVDCWILYNEDGKSKTYLRKARYELQGVQL